MRKSSSNCSCRTSCSLTSRPIASLGRAALPDATCILIAAANSLALLSKITFCASILLIISSNVASFVGTAIFYKILGNPFLPFGLVLGSDLWPRGTPRGCLTSDAVIFSRTRYWQRNSAVILSSAIHSSSTEAGVIGFDLISISEGLRLDGSRYCGPRFCAARELSRFRCAKKFLKTGRSRKARCPSEKAACICEYIEQLTCWQTPRRTFGSCHAGSSRRSHSPEPFGVAYPRFRRLRSPLPSTLPTVPPPWRRAPSPAVSPQSPRRIRPRVSATRRPQPATSSWEKLSRAFVAPSAPRSTEKPHFSRQTSAGLSPPGARTCSAFETQLWCWSDSRADFAGRSWQVSIL